MKVSTISALLFTMTVPLPGCQSSSGPATRFDPPSTDFAETLGITTPPPVTRDQAMAIAAAAAGGTAVRADQEIEGGQLFFEVQVQTSSARMEVEVRASDGGVVEIETADND